jgi:PAS domain S-box-containing protein
MSENSIRPIIYYVDDEPFNLTVFEAAAPEEWDVRTFDAASQAIGAMVTDCPWVVITDQRMPGINGVEFLEAVKDFDGDIVRIVVTGYADESLIIDSVRRAQIYDYIRKPWDADDLVSRIEKGCAHYKRVKKDRRVVEALKSQAKSGSTDGLESDCLASLSEEGVFWKKGVETHFTESFEAMLGYGSEDLATKTIDDLLAEDDQELWQKLARSMDQDLNQRNDPKFRQRVAVKNMRFRHLSGEKVWMRVKLAYQDGAGGDVLFGSLTDISELKQTEAALSRQALELRKSNEELEQFAFIASHDLQEPLRRISSFCSLLKEVYHEQLGSEAKEWIDFAVDGADRMQILIDDLLSFSRVSYRKVPDEWQDLAEVTEFAISNLALKIEETKARIEVEPLPSILGDKGQLVQLLQNLISNGLKFRSSEPPHITIGCDLREDEFSIFVKDRGIGIKPEFHQKIFEIFRRLHCADAYEGTGIGLSLVKKITERHKGRISVDSKPGMGSTFRLTFPKARGKDFPKFQVHSIEPLKKAG